MSLWRPSHTALSWSLLSALLMGLAWHTPGSVLCSLLGWAAVFALVHATYCPGASFRSLYAGGVLQNLLGFHWLAGTAQEFGGFSAPLAALVLVLFALVSGLQQVLYFFVFKRLPTFLDRFALRAAFAWVTIEFLAPRIFPWYVGHTQIDFSWFAQAADLCGVLLLSFVMISATESAWRFWSSSGTPAWARARCLLPILILSLCIFYGRGRWYAVNPHAGTPLHVAVVQANISTEDKGEIKLFKENRERYQSLSQELDETPALVIWPETVIQDLIYERVGFAVNDSRIPHFHGKHLLSGALTFRSRTEVFNSALAVFSDSRVSLPYHKQILMPFGEYMPLASTFPWIQDLNPIAAGLTAGESVGLMTFPPLLPITTREFHLAPLICYEDIVPSLSRAAVQQGAELLVNLTNDAWFGPTVAARQHHLIASFRAIENRRYLVRSTNSGLTAVVNPRGETVAELPEFSEGVIETVVHLRQDSSPYTRALGDYPWLVFSLLSCLSVAFAVLGGHRSRPQVVYRPPPK